MDDELVLAEVVACFEDDGVFDACRGFEVDEERVEGGFEDEGVFWVAACDGDAGVEG